MVANVTGEDIEVHIVTERQEREGIAGVLRFAGCSREELARQASRGRFESDNAQRAWSVLRSLD